MSFFLNKLASDDNLRRNKSIVMKTFHGYSIFTEILDMPSGVFNDNYVIIACSNEAVRRCKSHNIEFIPLSLFTMFYDESTDTLSKSNFNECDGLQDCPNMMAYNRMYIDYQLDRLNSKRICIILDPESGRKEDIYNLCRFRNRIYNSAGDKAEQTTIYVLNNVHTSMLFNKLEMVGLIKWMATKSEKGILDVRLDVSNNKLPGYNMELIYLANGIRKNTIPLDIPKQSRSYSLEVIGCSDDLKKKIDYERILADGSTIVTNDIKLMAYLNSSVRRSIYGNEVNKVHIGDKIVSYTDVYGENFIIPKGTVLMVNEIVRSDEEHIEAVVTSEYIINDILEDDAPKSAQVKICRRFLNTMSDSQAVGRLDGTENLNNSPYNLFAYAYAMSLDIASISSHNNITAIFDRHDPIMCEASIMLCRKYYRYIHIPLYYDVFDD